MTKTIIAMKKNHNRFPRLSKLSLFFAAIMVIGVIFAALELTGKTNVFRERQATSGVIPSTTNPESAPTSDEKTNVVSSSENPDSPESPKQGDSTSTPISAGAAPLKPHGNFISNHSPNLDDKPNPSAIQSVCNTSPGAKCHIEFTNNDGIIKQLAAQTVDNSGAAYWNWDIDEAGFTVGTWTINVIATLNGQTSATQDSQNLEVGP
jgi:hypothetical protein